MLISRFVYPCSQEVIINNPIVESVGAEVFQPIEEDNFKGRIEYMNEKQFTCNGKEWYFLRTFTVVEEGSGMLHESTLYQHKKNINNLGIALMLVMILVFSIVTWGILQIIPASQFKSNMNLVFIILNLCLIIGAFLMWVWYGYREVRIRKSTVTLPKIEEELILYKITENGIYINLYNRPNMEDMIFLDWSKVKNMSVDYMHYLPYYIKPTKSNKKQQKKKLHRLFNNMKRKLDISSYEPKFKYDDIRSFYLMHTNEKYLNELPIPPSWYENGVYDQFISELKRYVDSSDESLVNQFIRKQEQ